MDYEHLPENCEIFTKSTITDSSWYIHYLRIRVGIGSWAHDSATPDDTVFSASRNDRKENTMKLFTASGNNIFEILFFKIFTGISDPMSIVIVEWCFQLSKLEDKLHNLFSVTHFVRECVQSLIRVFSHRIMIAWNWLSNCSPSIESDDTLWTASLIMSPFGLKMSLHMPGFQSVIRT